MTEKTAYEEKWKEYIPQEARQHDQNASRESRKTIKEVSPEAFVEQRRSPGREMIMAWRSLIDYFRKKIDKPS